MLESLFCFDKWGCEIQRWTEKTGVGTGCFNYDCSACSSAHSRPTSTMSRLVSPRHMGKIQVESGEVRSWNHRAPPVARAACTAAQHTVRSDHGTTARESVEAYQAHLDSGSAEPERGWSTEAAGPKPAGLPWTGDSCPWCRAVRPGDAGSSGTGT